MQQGRCAYQPHRTTQCDYGIWGSSGVLACMQYMKMQHGQSQSMHLSPGLPVVAVMAASTRELCAHVCLCMSVSAYVHARVRVGEGGGAGC